MCCHKVDGWAYHLAFNGRPGPALSICGTSIAHFVIWNERVDDSRCYGYFHDLTHCLLEKVEPVCVGNKARIEAYIQERRSDAWCSKQ